MVAGTGGAGGGGDGRGGGGGGSSAGAGGGRAGGGVVVGGGGRSISSRSISSSSIGSSSRGGQRGSSSCRNVHSSGSSFWHCRCRRRGRCRRQCSNYRLVQVHNQQQAETSIAVPIFESRRGLPLTTLRILCWLRHWRVDLPAPLGPHIRRWGISLTALADRFRAVRDLS